MSNNGIPNADELVGKELPAELKALKKTADVVSTTASAAALGMQGMKEGMSPEQAEITDAGTAVILTGAAAIKVISNTFGNGRNG